MHLTFSPRLLFIFCTICFLPSIIFVALSTTSLAMGLSLASIVVLAINIRYVARARYDLRYVIVFGALISCLFLWSGFQAIVNQNNKPIFSSLVLTVVVVSANSLSGYMSTLRLQIIKQTVFIFSVLLLIVGWVKIFYVPEFLNYNQHIKATFPFSEESHYALSAGLFFCVYAFIGGVWRSVFILANVFALSVIYPSLTLLVFFILMTLIILIRLRPWMFRVCMLLVFPIAVVVTVAYAVNMPYFSSRLDFRSTENLTSLVFMQGWELARLNLSHTAGLGLGFQMLGSPDTVTGPLTNRVMYLASRNRALNLSDGGFLAAKLIAELGAPALLLLSYYVYWLIRLPLRINSLYQRRSLSNINGRYILYGGIIFSFAIEVFLRGYGYFSPGAFLFVSAIFSIHAEYRSRVGAADPLPPAVG